MNRKFIPVEEVAKEWMKRPEFVAAYDALEDEFAMAAALIKARAGANMTQEDVAKAMGTTQAAIARLEGGPVEAFDADAGAFRQGDRHEVADKLRAGEGERAGGAVSGRGAAG